MIDQEEGLEVKGLVDLSVRIGDLNDTIDKDLEARRMAREQTPVVFKFPNTATIPTPTAPTAIGLSGPEQGFFWELRTLSIGGLSWGTTAAGTAEVYVTSQNGAMIATNRSLTDIVDATQGGATLPITGGYSSGQIILQAGEKLRIVIVGGTAGQQYSAVAWYRQFRTIAYATEINA